LGSALTMFCSKSCPRDYRRSDCNSVGSPTDEGKRATVNCFTRPIPRVVAQHRAKTRTRASRPNISIDASRAALGTRTFMTGIKAAVPVSVERRLHPSAPPS
jgi:hypothetical protein